MIEQSENTPQSIKLEVVFVEALSGSLNRHSVNGVGHPLAEVRTLYNYILGSHH